MHFHFSIDDLGKKLNIKIYLIIIVFFSGITNSFSQGSKSISITNTAAVVRPDELVTFKRAAIEKHFGNSVKFIAVDYGQQQLVVQHIDLNGDRKWDEAAFVFSFEPNKKYTFLVSSVADTTILSATTRAHVRLRKKITDTTFGPATISETMPLKNPPTDFSKHPLPLYLTEGPAWENDKVAFRLYFDTRNNKDIYGKTTAKMMMDTVGANTKVSYHDLSDWGMDVLHVVKSLGAGSLAISVPRQTGSDTIIRLGGADIKRTTYTQVADGPLVAKFRVSYDWEINNKLVVVKEDISIKAGKFFYESKVTITGAPANAKLITGIADFYENTFKTLTEGDATLAYSYGHQSENKDNLGLAVLVNNKSFAGVDSINRSNTDVNETYTIAQTIKDNTPLYYRFYACWERSDPAFTTMGGFTTFLRDEAVRYSNPLKLQWLRKK